MQQNPANVRGGKSGMPSNNTPLRYNLRLSCFPVHDENPV
jgi:hypothetical protein